MATGIAPYPGALGTVTPYAPARFSPGGNRTYSLMGDGDSMTSDGMMITSLTAGVALGGMASSAIGGAIIGGLASAKWSGAGTGALVSGGLAGLAGGLGVAAMPGEGSTPTGLVVAAAGAGMFGYGLYRWNKLRKGGR